MGKRFCSHPLANLWHTPWPPNGNSKWWSCHSFSGVGEQQYSVHWLKDINKSKLGHFGKWNQYFFLFTFFHYLTFKYPVNAFTDGFYRQTHIKRIDIDEFIFLINLFTCFFLFFKGCLNKFKLVSIHMTNWSPQEHLYTHNEVLKSSQLYQGEILKNLIFGQILGNMPYQNPFRTSYIYIYWM